MWAPTAGEAESVDRPDGTTHCAVVPAVATVRCLYPFDAGRLSGVPRGASSGLAWALPPREPSARQAPLSPSATLRDGESGRPGERGPGPIAVERPTAAAAAEAMGRAPSRGQAAARPAIAGAVERPTAGTPGRDIAGDSRAGRAAAPPRAPRGGFSPCGKEAWCGGGSRPVGRRFAGGNSCA